MTQSTKLRYDPSSAPDMQAVAHVEDPTKYGRPDITQQRFVGANATVIPRAIGHASSGRSSFTTELNIDPTDPATGAGGTRVNLEHLDKATMDKALGKAGSAEEAWQLVRSLQAPTQPEKPSAVVGRQAAPEQSVVVQQQSKLLAQLDTLLPATDNAEWANRRKLEEALAAKSLPAAPEVAPPPSPPQPSSELSEQLSQRLSVLTQIVATMVQNQQPAPVVESPPAKAEPKETSDVLASLGLSFLSSSPDGGKPTVPVVFQMGPGGQASAKFHHVNVYGGLVVLAFDTRWDGYQFFPPAVDYTIGIKLPATNKTYRVHSQDCVFPFGKLEFCVLVIDAESTETPEEQQEAADGLPRLAPRVPRTLPQQRNNRPPEFDTGSPDDEDLPPIL